MAYLDILLKQGAKFVKHPDVEEMVDGTDYHNYFLERFSLEQLLSDKWEVVKIKTKNEQIKELQEKVKQLEGELDIAKHTILYRQLDYKVMECDHVYPNPWMATIPPSCTKCGRQAPHYGPTWTVTSHTTTGTSEECDHEWDHGPSKFHIPICKKCKKLQPLDIRTNG